MEKILKVFEKVIIVTLLVLMMIAVFFATIELAIIIFEQIVNPPFQFLILLVQNDVG